MTDLEKVVKGLECCDDTSRVSLKCEECPYREADTCSAIKRLHDDALALLKAQEAVPVIQREVMHLFVWCCGSCGVAITEGDRFCRMCGRKVKWG